MDGAMADSLVRRVRSSGLLLPGEHAAVLPGGDDLTVQILILHTSPLGDSEIRRVAVLHSPEEWSVWASMRLGLNYSPQV